MLNAYTQRALEHNRYLASKLGYPPGFLQERETAVLKYLSLPEEWVTRLEIEYFEDLFPGKIYKRKHEKGVDVFVVL